MNPDDKGNSMDTFLYNLYEAALTPFKIPPCGPKINDIKSSRKREIPAANSSEVPHKVFVTASDQLKELSKEVKLAIPPRDSTKLGYRKQDVLPIVKEQNDLQKMDSNGRNKNPSRDLRLITGKISFILNVHKVYPKIEALFLTFGKVLKLTKGEKHPYQNLILLRGQEGPVLQVLYYEIDRNLPEINQGHHIRCVGRFTGHNKIQAYKITPISCLPSEETFCRLQNLNSFTLKKIIP